MSFMLMLMFPQRCVMSATFMCLELAQRIFRDLRRDVRKALALAARESTRCKHHPRFDELVNAAHLPRRWQLGIELCRAAQ